MFHHYITGPTQREEILRERKIKRFLNFIKQNYTDFEEERLREKGKMFPHYIIGPPQREEILREILIIFRGVFKFHFLKYATMNFVFCWEANISLVVLSCGLRETSSVDYTDFEDLKILIEKSFCKIRRGGGLRPPPFRGAVVVAHSSLPLPPPPLPPPPKKKKGEKGEGKEGKSGGMGGRRRRGDAWKRVSTGLNVFQQVWTCFNRSERVSTGSNGSQQVPTGSDGFQWVPPNMDTTRMFLDVSGLFR